MREVRITAPAKVNLGLEILGRRGDGYHEIATVMAMVDLCDVIRLTPRDGYEIAHGQTIRGVTDAEDLTIRALSRVKTHDGTIRGGATIGLEKVIPIAAGLGGASSDAAAALVAAHHFWGRPIDQEEIHRDAVSLGSDVPFFLSEPCALATGTGTTLEPLPAPLGWLVIVAPRFRLKEKTKRMYAALQPSDFSDGARVVRVATKLRARQLPEPDDLHNAFARPLYEMAPNLAQIPEIMCRHAGTFAALSGAGSSHYTWFRTAAEARCAAGRMASRLPEHSQVYVAPFAKLRLEDRLTISLA